MKPRIIFLGTGAAIPSMDRYVSCILIQGVHSLVLLDVGEGCQIRLHRIGIDPIKIDIIAISHLHGDHFLGLYPLLQTMSVRSTSQRKRKRLLIIAPRTLCNSLTMSMEDYFVVECKGIECHQDDKGTTVCNPIVETPSQDISLIPFRVEHGNTEAYGFIINIVKDRKRLLTIPIAYLGDGLCGEECYKVLQLYKPWIIIHEATYADSDRLKALASGHATFSEAGFDAAKLGANALVLTHISQRYSKDIVLKDFVRQTRKYYIKGQIIVAEDFLTLFFP